MTDRVKTMKEKTHDRAWFKQKVVGLGEAMKQLPEGEVRDKLP